ncbi:MAG: type II toxin-antitoxin system VapC family toxin [Syntrophobacteraceae bacterium]|nr:type II toxin-antitoxin system VapC family toxin [Syntrophobacteraceae bacterium]
MKVFFDTSAFVKRYVEEPGTEKVLEICDRAEQLVLCIICLPEMISTLNRLVREGKLPGDDYQKLRDLILKEIEDAEICCLTPEVVGQTIRCLENNVLRAMDALHLGCALVVEPDLFVSSDQRQIEAAKREGLKVLEA